MSGGLRGQFAKVASRPLLLLDPERAHGLAISALKSGLPLAAPPPPDPRLASAVAGLSFPNPLGMAAGFDKDAEVPDALLRLGFGFAEVGTVTPLPQPGNPRPRLFRLRDGAVINRLGFNNQGHAAAASRLAQRSDTGNRAGIVGVNIGANKDSADRIGDYVAGVRRFAPLAAYLTVNISSPNTPGLRDMQARGALSELLRRVTEARDAAPRRVPLFLKIAPDLGEADLADIAAEVEAHGVEGVVATNTTLGRPALAGPNVAEAGGLSGRPLFERSTIVLARLRRRLGPKVAIIGAGGVDSAGTALEKIRAGADLVQLYTGMVFAGPGLPGEILCGLSRALDRAGATSMAALRGETTDEWAGRPL